MSSKSSPDGAGVSDLLHRAVQLSADLYAERAGPEGLTLRQFAVLLAVSQAEGSTQSQLVAITGVDRSTLAELLARLADRGLVARARSGQDARKNLVALTGLGRNLLEAARPLAGLADKALLDRLPEDRRKRFLKDLRRLVVGPEVGGKGKEKKKSKAGRDGGGPSSADPGADEA